jgi:hypothetical protein
MKHAGTKLVVAPILLSFAREHGIETEAPAECGREWGPVPRQPALPVLRKLSAASNRGGAKEGWGARHHLRDCPLRCHSSVQMNRRSEAGRNHRRSEAGKSHRRWAAGWNRHWGAGKSHRRWAAGKNRHWGAGKSHRRWAAGKSHRRWAAGKSHRRWGAGWSRRHNRRAARCNMAAASAGSRSAGASSAVAGYCCRAGSRETSRAWPPSLRRIHDSAEWAA